MGTGYRLLMQWLNLFSFSTSYCWISWSINDVRDYLRIIYLGTFFFFTYLVSSFPDLIKPAIFIILELRFQGKRLLVLGTTSEVSFLDSVGICDAFSVTYLLPTLKAEDAKKVIWSFDVQLFILLQFSVVSLVINGKSIKHLFLFMLFIIKHFL